MCSPAVRLRGTDRWPFWLALAVSWQHPIPLAQMVFYSRAKTNSSSTQGPNKITDLKLQGHAWRFRVHLSALLISQEKNEMDRRREGRGGVEFMKWILWQISFFYLTHIFLTSLLWICVLRPAVFLCCCRQNYLSVKLSGWFCDIFFFRFPVQSL